MTLPLLSETLVPTLAAAGLFLSAMAMAPAIAQDADAAKPGTITVSATGTGTATPDMATLSVSVMREADTARAALDANNEAMAFVLASFREAGIEERDLQTSGFGIQPRYFYPKQTKDGEQEPPRIIGYTVTNGLTVRVRDLSRLGDILDRSVTMGVNDGGNISFGSTDPTPFIKTARTNAMKEAIAKATTLTEAAGVRLGRIVKISETDGRRPSPRPWPAWLRPRKPCPCPLPRAKTATPSISPWSGNCCNRPFLLSRVILDTKNHPGRSDPGWPAPSLQRQVTAGNWKACA